MAIKHQVACYEFRNQWQHHMDLAGTNQLHWLWSVPDVDDVIQTIRYNIDINTRMVVVWDLNHGGTKGEL